MTVLWYACIVVGTTIAIYYITKILREIEE